MYTASRNPNRTDGVTNVVIRAAHEALAGEWL